MTNERVLLARQDNNGDVLLTGPAVRAVAAKAQNVTFLAGPRGRAAAHLLPGVDEVLIEHASWIDAEPQPIEPGKVYAFIDTINSRSFDRAIIFTSFHQSPLPLALLLRIAGIPMIAAISDDYPGNLLDIRHRMRDDIHEVERDLSLVAQLGYSLPEHDDRRLHIERAEGQATWPWRNGEYVVVHPGATVPARAWSAEKNAALVRALSVGGRTVVVTGGNEEFSLARYVAGNTSGVYNACGLTTFPQFAAIIAGAHAVICGNTAAAHVAAAVQTPVISLFPPTIPAVRFRPWMVPHVLLGVQDIACRGCRARVCPFEAQPCLDRISVDDVLAALHHLTGTHSPVPA
ncbi:MAG: glycosyltransferase family 9 protein [Candidatus Eremiobacteraeota bacterium]|nr:glycosyltransferase family 9 protein [Candidatus Eremiobacteraeota bacterium]